MESLNNFIKFAEKHCQDKGQRLTRKRKTVLKALLESKKAISAYELVSYCESNLSETISAMSVYRILEFLQTQGLVHRLESANKYVACSDITCENRHTLSQFLICEQCQHVEKITIDEPILKYLQAEMNKIGFHLKNPKLEANGICSRCFPHT